MKRILACMILAVAAVVIIGCLISVLFVTGIHAWSGGWKAFLIFLTVLVFLAAMVWASSAVSK